ncbi:AraC family transcriptional regulator [Paenibacillus doosanensis]|uniref:HTH-type transcriptional activator Btr n=1 Tax=Paenibacillus konkukensis TaxID=2020716 RepID=A0ABY4RX61_9BACL|nr:MULTISPECIES: AraC family transcriptional regulator [Paenibacillus]MCS7458868.1 AraC family transcriptional regulator [Paenibacillus doosanensis]UQZ86603.1 HTH-type transcriptional activator Btr [Paenibacillus konkukensis]
MLHMETVRQDTGVQWFEEYEEGAPWYLLILVTYGKCLYWVHQEKLMLEKGDLLLIPSGVPFYGKSIPTVMHEKYVAAFRDETSSPALPLLSAQDFCKWKTGKYELLLQRFRMMHEEWNEQLPYREAMCQSLALEILTHWNRELDEGKPTSVKERHIELMKAYIQNHYREKVTKEDLANAIGKSPNYAASLFSGVTGQTIGGYVHALRVKTAVYLLTHSRRTVADISDYLGYCDPSYFHRIFKRETGKLPAAYIKERELPVQ